VACIDGVNLSARDLKQYLHLLLDTKDKSSIPPAVGYILAFRACRGTILPNIQQSLIILKGAVKFGDSLTPSDCKNLIKRLQTCQNPFVCAHGRPSIVPLLHLQKLEEKCRIEVEKPNISRLVSNMKKEEREIQEDL